MSITTGTLAKVFAALLLVPACSGGTGANGAGSGGRNGGSGGTPTMAGTGGNVSGTGGTVGTGGSGVTGSTGGTAGGGGSSGGVGGVAGASPDTGGNPGVGTGGGGAPGTGGTTGAAGAGGTSAGGVPHVVPQSATAVPAQYRTAVANPGKWTSRTYPVYYYTTDSTGSPSQTGSIPRQSTPITKPCNVYTPPNYDPQTQYPLIFVFHGITDNQDTWEQRGDPKPNVLLDNLIVAKIIQPVIAVFPQGDSKPNYATNTSYSDTAGYYLFGNELMNDLVPFIEANYSVKKDRGSRAISGFSMGGMQTINIGLCQNLKNFAWFGAFDPAGGNFGASQIAQYLKAEDVQTNPVYYFYISVGSSDSTAGTSAAASANGLATMGAGITSANFSFQNNIPGGHVYPTATVGLYNFVRMAFAAGN